MIVYGDRVRNVEPRALIADIRERLAKVETSPPGIVRHGMLAGALLEAGELAQGLADAAQEAAGCDEPSAKVDVVMALLRALSLALLRSWNSGFRELGEAVPVPDVDHPDPVEARTPEGFAFYAVYPEAYASASAMLDRPARVIGVRSIGTVLSSVVAAAIGADIPPTVRPVGHPFARTLKVGKAAGALLLAEPAKIRVVVDEGPGASGSSFGSVADWLEENGVAPQNIAFLPSHPGAPGAMASPRHRARWRHIARPVTTFDELSLATHTPDHRLGAWFADLVGRPVAPLRDVSGGGWRGGRDVPSAPSLERRKLLLQTARGAWLLKFAGLGRIGEEKFRLARALHAAGFVPEPIAVRHGFLLERWHGDAGPVVPSVEHLGRYLGFRARQCPAGDADGASGDALRAMALHNVRERLGEAAGASLVFRTRSTAPRVRIDGRLHAWEWLGLPDGRVLKADALDHHAAHDLIGCQPIAWDIAGAIVEWELPDPDAARLLRIVDDIAGHRTDPLAVVDHITFYCAFQLGLWPQEHAGRYERRLNSRRCPP